ncbi:MAG: hypothetical protein DME52_10310 [Verrucomicrobia bacterium]|nr:MAG: hypothetical protein DME52_10310 [Verrucomicrobiota bacterium]
MNIFFRKLLLLIHVNNTALKPYSPRTSKRQRAVDNIYALHRQMLIAKSRPTVVRSYSKLLARGSEML